MPIEPDHPQLARSEFSGENTGYLCKNGEGAYSTLQDKRDATVAPGATDDSNAGYAVGSRWVDLVADKEYICLDAAPSEAVWKETTAQPGAAGDPANDIATSSAQQQTTSVEYVLATGMTLTPASGTYLVWFTGDAEQTSNSDSVFASVFSAGSQVTTSEQTVRRGAGQGDVRVPFCSVARVAVNGSQAIEGKIKVSAGTGSVYNRNLMILKVAAGV